MEIFDYDNILLLPRKCRVDSRSECDAGVELGGRRFRIPVVPANMKTVVNEAICVWMAKNGYFYVMHRFDLDNVQFIKDMVAQGVTPRSLWASKSPTTTRLTSSLPWAWCLTTSRLTLRMATLTACSA